MESCSTSKLVLGVIDSNRSRSSSAARKDDVEKLKGWTFPNHNSSDSSLKSLGAEISRGSSRNSIRNDVKVLPENLGTNGSGEGGFQEMNLSTISPPHLSITPPFTTFHLDNSPGRSPSISFAYARKSSLLLSSPIKSNPKSSSHRQLSPSDITLFLLFMTSLFFFTQSLAGRGYVDPAGLTLRHNSQIVSTTPTTRLPLVLSIDDVPPEVHQPLGDTTQDIGDELVMDSPEGVEGGDEHAHHHHGSLGLFKANGDNLSEEFGLDGRAINEGERREEEDNVLELIGQEDGFSADSLSTLEEDKASLGGRIMGKQRLT
jgi:hypothetical protein